MIRNVLAPGLALAVVLVPAGDLHAQTCSSETVILDTESFDNVKYKDPSSSVDGWGTGALTPVEKKQMFSGATQSVGQQVYVVADADWDGDGWRDMVSLMLTPTCHLHYLKNKRTTGTAFNGFDAGVDAATFAQYTLATPPGCGTESPVLLTGDFDGDGQKDLLYMRVTGENNAGLVTTAVVYRFAGLSGSGVPRFDAPVSVLPSFSSVAWHWTGSEAKVVDWPPKDGIDDLLVVNSQGTTNQLLLYRGNGALGFSSPQILINDLGLATRIADATKAATGNASCPPVISRGGTALAVADFDGDGDLDVVVGSVSEKDLKYWKNDGADNFTAATNIPFAEGAACVAIAADFDGDGDLDLMIGRDGKNCNGLGGTVWLFENDGTGTFTKHTTAVANLGGDLDFGIAFNMDNDPKGQIDALFADGNDTGVYTTVVSQTFGVYNLTGTAVSLPVADLTASNDAIVNAKVTWNAANLAPPDQDILIYLSNDNGKTWEPATKGADHPFTSYGSILRWKAVFKAPEQVLTGDAAAFAPGTKNPPTLNDISISYERVDRRAYTRSAVAWGDVDLTSSTAGERLYSAYYYYPGFQAHLVSYDISSYQVSTKTSLERVDTNAKVTSLWDSGDLLASRLASSRTIYAAYTPTSSKVANGRVDFTEAELNAPTSTLPLKTGMAVDDATKLAALRFVRGRLGDDSGDRTWKLFDPGHSSPVFVGPTNSGDASHVGYMDLVATKGSTYAKFAKSNEGRAPMVYLGGNDGMLHAFDARTGSESWALIPNNLLAKVKSQRYVSSGTERYLHDFFVDGPVTVGEIFDGSTWKTIAVVSEAKGQGRDGNNFYFAVDITTPSDPKPLWEFTDSLLPAALNCKVPLDRTKTVCTNTCGAACTDSNDTFVDSSGVIVIEAETSSAKASIDGTHTWSSASTLTGASGGSYVQALPDTGKSCTVSNLSSTCGAQLTYNLDVSSPGTYYVYFRLNDTDSSSDRIFWGLNGTPFSTKIEAGTYGSWRWVSGGNPITLGGESTLSVWMGKDGACLDKIYISPINAAPSEPSPAQRCCHSSCDDETYSDKGDETKEWPECGSGSGMTCCKTSQKCKAIGTCGAADPTDPVTGETWSPPVITRVVVDGAARWVVFFGSGYNNRGASVPFVGRSLYAVDATTGVQLGRWDVTDLPTSAANPSTIANAIPAGAAVADFSPTTGQVDGYADRLYVGDLEGRLYRLDVSSSAPSSGVDGVWKLTNIFDAGAPDGVSPRVWAPIITKPALAVLKSTPTSTTYSVYVYFGTGGDDAAPSDQAYSFYAIRDDDTSVTRVSLDGSNAQEFKVKAPAGFKYWSDPIVINHAVVYFTALQGSIESVDPCLSLDGTSRVYAYGIQTIGGSRVRAGQAYMDPIESSGKVRQTFIVRGVTSSDPTGYAKPAVNTKGQELLGQKFAATSAADKPEVVGLNGGAILPLGSALKVLYWREVPLQ